MDLFRAEIPISITPKNGIEYTIYAEFYSPCTGYYYIRKVDESKHDYPAWQQVTLVQYKHEMEKAHKLNQSLVCDDPRVRVSTQELKYHRKRCRGLWYDYHESLKEDVAEYIRREIRLEGWEGRKDELREHLLKVLRESDEVTGARRGYYFLHPWEAERAQYEGLLLKMHYIEEITNMVPDESDTDDAPDVALRIILLPEILDEVLSEI